MTLKTETKQDNTQANISQEINQGTETEKILCPHCLRTASNGIKCKGICVADNDY